MKTAWGSYCRRSRRGEKESIINGYGRYIETENFTGTAHPALAKEISDYIGVPLGKSLCGRFNNGEIQVMINESVRGKDCFIIQPTGSPVMIT